MSLSCAECPAYAFRSVHFHLPCSSNSVHCLASDRLQRTPQCKPPELPVHLSPVHLRHTASCLCCFSDGVCVYRFETESAPLCILALELTGSLPIYTHCPQCSASLAAPLSIVCAARRDIVSGYTAGRLLVQYCSPFGSSSTVVLVPSLSLSRNPHDFSSIGTSIFIMSGTQVAHAWPNLLELS